MTLDKPPTKDKQQRRKNIGYIDANAAGVPLGWLICKYSMDARVCGIGGSVRQINHNVLQAWPAQYEELTVTLLVRNPQLIFTIHYT